MLRSASCFPIPASVHYRYIHISFPTATTGTLKMGLGDRSVLLQTLLPVGPSASFSVAAQGPDGPHVPLNLPTAGERALGHTLHTSESNSQRVSCPQLA